MTKSELRNNRIVEAHRILNQEAKRVVQRIGRRIPREAYPDYLTDEDISVLKEVVSARLDHSVVKKSMHASVARSKVLSILPKMFYLPKSWMHWEAFSYPPVQSARLNVLSPMPVRQLFSFSFASWILWLIRRWSRLSTGLVLTSFHRAKKETLHDIFFDKYWAEKAGAF